MDGELGALQHRLSTSSFTCHIHALPMPVPPPPPALLCVSRFRTFRQLVGATAGDATFLLRALKAEPCQSAVGGGGGGGGVAGRPQPGVALPKVAGAAGDSGCCRGKDRPVEADGDGGGVAVGK